MMRHHLSIQQLVVLVTVAALAILQGCATAPRGKQSRFTGKWITFDSRPPGVPVYNSNVNIGTTPFVYELRSMSGIDPEFIFYQCPNTPTIYQLPDATTYNPVKATKSAISMVGGIWFQGKKYYKATAASGEGVIVPSKIMVEIELNEIAVGGMDLVTQLANGPAVDSAHARKLLQPVLEHGDCEEAGAFLRNPLVARQLLSDREARFRSSSASALERASWAPADSLESARFEFARQNWTALQGGGGQAVIVLVEGLGENQASIADSCSTVLLRLGPRAVDELVAALHASNSNLRRRCVDLLGRIGDPRAVEALARLVREDPGVRTTVASALARLGSPAQSVLLELLVDQDQAVRDAVLVPIGAFGRENGQVVEALIHQLDHLADESSRAYVALALGEVGPTAMAACSSLVDAFPIITTSSDVNYTIGTPASGGIVDYRVERVVLDASHPYIRQAFSRQLESYGGHFTFVSVDGVASTYYQTTNDVSQGSYVSVAAKVSTKLYAGAWALAKISGVDLGLERDKWSEWVHIR